MKQQCKFYNNERLLDNLIDIERLPTFRYHKYIMGTMVHFNEQGYKAMPAPMLCEPLATKHITKPLLDRLWEYAKKLPEGIYNPSWLNVLDLSPGMVISIEKFIVMIVNARHVLYWGITLHNNSTRTLYNRLISDDRSNKLILVLNDCTVRLCKVESKECRILISDLSRQIINGQELLAD